MQMPDTERQITSLVDPEERQMGASVSWQVADTEQQETEVDMVEDPQPEIV